jgi:DNA-binding SARP family transcriptional activator/tetratricopeptide (TPR) repeat protein
VAEVAELRVHLLGGLSVEGVPVLSLGSRKARAVLRRLAVAAGGYVAGDELVDVAWPEGPPARAGEQLGVLVSRLRAVVGTERLERHPAGYALHADWLDTSAVRTHVHDGEAALQAGRSADALSAGRAAVALLRGPVLPEDDSEAVQDERAAVERYGVRARLLTAEAALATGAPWEALELATQCREQDPYDETALRLVLRALAATSRTAQAVTVYLEAAAALREDLGTDPEPETEQLYLDLLREQPAAATSRAAAPTAPAGREAELSVLSQHWDRSAAGSPSLVVVEGPAGIGKSTLLEALSQQVGGDALVLRAAPDALGAELPLQPLFDVLRQVLAEHSDNAALALLGADGELLGPLLGRAPGRVSTASSFAAVTSGSARAVLLSALDGMVERLSQDRPVLLMLDDAHAADASTAQLLQHCCRPGLWRRLLVVVATRPSEGPTWQGTRLAVGPLDRAAVVTLVGEARADELLQRSGGHPLFLAELARHEGADPPASVLAAIAARCAGTDEVGQTLRTAAVLGAPDDVDLLAQVQDLGRRQVLAHLEAGLRQGLLVEDVQGCTFAHQMFREAFAAAVGPTRAAALHREAAQVLSHRRTTDPRRVAHHADLGGEPRLAAEALTAAAQLASLRYEHAEALSLLDRAIAHEDVVPRRLARARVLLVLGRYDEAQADADDALSRGAGAAGLEVAALAAYFERDLDRALELADEGAAIATDPELAAGCWCLAGRTLLTMGRLDEALERLGEATDLATGPMRAVAAVWRATTLAMRGSGNEAYRLARSATASSARHDPAVEPYREVALGRALTTLDRPYEALQAFEQLATVVERQQLGRFAGRAENYRSWVLRNLGAHQEAADATASAWELVGPLRDLGHAEAHSHAALDLADTALRAGRLDDADTWLTRMSQAPTTPHVMRWRIDLRHDLLRGRWALASGDAVVAAELAEQVRSAAERLGVPRFARQAEVLSARSSGAYDLERLSATAAALATAAPLESWWLLAELARDTGEQRFLALARERVDALLAGAGPYAEPLKTAAHLLLEGG